MKGIVDNIFLIEQLYFDLMNEEETTLTHQYNINKNSLEIAKALDIMLFICKKMIDDSINDKNNING